MTFIQIDNKVKELKPIEAFVLGFITARIGKKKNMQISLGLIAKVSSGKTTPKTKATASKHLKTLQDKGLIKIYHNAGKTMNTYEVVKPVKFTEINYDIFLPEYNMISPKAKGLFIKMANIAFKDNGRIDKTEKEIYTELKISEDTYYKLRKELINNDLLENKQLSDKWFRIAKKAKKDYKTLFTNKLEEVKEEMNMTEDAGRKKRFYNQLVALKGYMEEMIESNSSYKYGYQMLIRIQSDTFKNQKDKKSTIQITL